MSRKYVIKHCFLCGDRERVRELYPQTFSDVDLDPSIFSARRVTEHFHYRMVGCDNCGLVFSREILGDGDLYELYSRSGFTFAEVTGSLREDYWRPLAHQVSERAPESALEIGCSNGFFLEELQARGFKEVVGCEPSREAKEHASPIVRDSIHSGFFEGKKSFPGKTFDLVCSFHTLDHLSDPQSFLENCREVLKPGGLVYFVTHDVKALQAKILGEKSPIIDIEHVYLFNRKTLRQALEASGFQTIEVGRLKNRYPLRYWMKMLPMHQGLKQRAQKVLEWTGLSEWSPAIAAGNIYAVAQMPGGRSLL